MRSARRDRLADPVDRATFTAARDLARACVGELLTIPASQVRLAQRCPTCDADDHGRPFVVDHPEVGVSWSHAHGHVVALAAHGPCGIDVEPRVTAPPPRRALTGSEARWVASGGDFTHLWTRKEALVKAGVADLDEAGSLDVLASTVRGLDLRTWRDGAATVSSATQPIGSSTTQPIGSRTAQPIGSRTNTGIFRSVFFWYSA
ncbi:4'-phosphopantetheinyl transferase superfamily protein [Aeromicrobium sp. Marseille-Q0843]|uniref:4'-phosphopantetheinyl transferase superfamily protein n=1 Tax=Aeromicrobium phoceense TaxID=2754045 RepID=A0A838XHR8_9ACTN|nr:4'-phosphopantetheinyl transferase superfamily protein [Aeromicrobium phoceense]MBA4608308.1 4'-phosphopantetheinyl transferase superfamily protein [Aeromicrobium phoceense]